MKKLYELRAYIKCHAVIAAENKEQALAHVETWENSWFQIGEFGEVSDVDVVDVRDIECSDNVMVEAHSVAYSTAAEGGE